LLGLDFYCIDITKTLIIMKLLKKLFTGIVLVFPLLLFAQAPQGLNYQALAWDNNNLPKQNKTLTVIWV